MRRPNPLTHAALLLSILLSMPTAPKLAAQQKPLERTLLWEISGNGLLHPSYLYGTMHVQDKRAFDFSDSVLLKLRSCSIFASEIELDSGMRKTFGIFLRERLENGAADAAIDEDEPAAPLDVIPDTTADGIDPADMPVEISRDAPKRRMRGRNPFSGDFFNPSSTAHPDDKPVVLDAYLYRLAKHEGMKVVGLEQVEEQLDAFEAISFSDIWQFYVKGGKKSKKRSVPPTDPEEVQELILKLYHRGDLTGINSFFVENWPPAYYKALLTNRNHHMADRAVKYMEEGGTFIAVGAGHLPGEEGLIELFRRKGYTVRPVKAIHTGLAASFTEGTVRPAWHTFSSPEGAFAVEMPAEPIDISALTDGHTETQMNERSRSFLWPDLGSGLTYAVVYTDYSHDYLLLKNFQGRSSPPPSFQLFYGQERFLDGLDNGTPATVPGRESGPRTITSGELSGREILVDAEGGSIRRTRLFLRGNRLYTLSAQGSGDVVHSADADTFFGSFRALEPIRSQWREYAADGYGFSIKVPETPTALLDTQLLSAIDIRAVFIAQDRNNGQAYGVARSRFSKYYQSAGIDTFFSDAVDELMRYGDSVVAMRTIVQDGFPGRDLEIVHMERRYAMRIRVVLKGDQLYTLRMEGSAGQLQTSDANTFFDSFRLTDTTATGDLFVGKIDHIFEDIASGDSITRVAAVSALRRYERLKTEQLPRLYALIEQPYSDDGEEYGTRVRLIESLRDVSDSGTVPFLRRLAPSIADLAYLRSMVLSTLTIIKGPAALVYLNELLADSASVELLSPYFFYPFIDDTASFRFLFPSVLSLIDREDQRWMIQMLIVEALDSGIIDPAMIASSTPSIVDELRAALKSKRNRNIEEGKERDNTSRIWSAIRCLGRLPGTPEIDLLLMEAFSDSDRDVKMRAAVALIRHNRPVPDPALRIIAADPAARIELYRELEHAGRIDRFPRQYRSQKDIAEGLLAEWLIEEYYDDSPDSVRLIGEREVTLGGEQGRVYLFAFHYGEKNESWRVGISGLQPIDREKIASTGRRVLSLDGKLEEMSVEAHFDALLNEKLDADEE